MVDSLDMHAVVGDAEAFRRAVQTLLGDFESGVLTFDRDVTVSVFEASIRVVGGLVRRRASSESTSMIDATCKNALPRTDTMRHLCISSTPFMGRNGKEWTRGGWAI